MSHKIEVQPAASSTDARVRRSRAALRDALVALAGERPFAELTVAEIARRAGVGYATFFRHFASKEALLADIAEGLILDLLPLMRPLMERTETHAAALALARFVAAQRPICHALLVGAGEAVRREISARAVHLSSREPEPDNGLPAELSTVHAVSATLGILSWWLDRGAGMDADALAQALERLVFAPLAGRAGKSLS